MIPKTLTTWIGNHWTRDDYRTFWYHQEQKTLAPRRLYERSRDYHELGHLIVAPDKDINDPYWGLREFTTDNPREKLKARSFRIEAEVEVVAKVIEAWLLNNRSNKGDLFFMHVKYDDPWAVARSINRYGNIGFKATLEVCTRAKARWTIEAIWAETVRKYQLWEQTPIPGPWTVQPRDSRGRWISM